jgi:hypothetical protein
MPDRANDPLLEAPELSETAQAIARGRELVKQAQQLGEEADRQIEEVQATLEQADRVLDRSHQILVDTSASPVPSGTGSTPDTEEA